MAVGGEEGDEGSQLELDTPLTVLGLTGLELTLTIGDTPSTIYHCVIDSHNVITHFIAALLVLI